MLIDLTLPISIFKTVSADLALLHEPSEFDYTHDWTL